MNTPDGPVAERPGFRDSHGMEQQAVPLRLALRDQVLRFSVPDSVSLKAGFAFREKPHWRDEGSPARLVPRLKPWACFVGAGELIVKARAFDDGLLAAVEVASQEACGSFPGKRPLLRALRERLTGGGPAAALLEASCELDGWGSASSPAALEALRSSLANDLQPKPLGFYTWSEELGRIFRQDRLLQAELAGTEDAPDVAAVLASAPELLAGYGQCLRLAERCTNRLSAADFRPWAEALARGGAPPTLEDAGDGRTSLALFPASRAHETDLARRLYGFRHIPDDADLLRDVIRAVRAGEIDLRPAPTSGWYDWQTSALETLVSPERAEESGRAVLDQSYRDHLESLFRAALALGRETHVKQLEVIACGAAMERPVILRPDLRLEPLVTHYARRADGYRYIRGALEESLGEPALGGLHRLRPEGPVEAPLREELEFMIALFDGAANIARLELGAPSQGDTDVFARWMESRGGDPDITADLRMMVPVYSDLGRKRTKVWMFLGWMEDSIEVGFARLPEVRILSGGNVKLGLEESSFPIARPVVVEALVSRVLNRDEFRALCDCHTTPEAIVRAVE